MVFPFAFPSAVGYDPENSMTSPFPKNPESGISIAEGWDLFCKERESILSQNLSRISFFLDLARKFKKAGIPVLPLKGLDLILRAYPSPGMRPMTDIDLLIQKKDARKVMAILEQKGLKRRPDEGLTYLSADGLINLDILWDIWYLSEKEHETLWDRAVLRSYEEHAVHCLHPEDFLIYHASFTAAHRGSLTPAFKQDLDFFLPAEAGSISWSALSIQAGRLGLRPALYHAFSYAEIPAEKNALFKPRGFSEKAVSFLYRRLVTEAPRLHVSYFFSWLEYPKLRGKFKLLREKLIPSPFEVEIHRGLKGFNAYLFFLASHPFVLFFRALTRRRQPPRS